MNNQLNEIEILQDSGISFEEMATLKTYMPFAEIVCDFLDLLSKKLLKNQDYKQYPDVITFAFFCRKSSISGFKNRYKENISNRLGRGLSFHITPSNVPINFAYSLISGLLSGSPCIVRTSSKHFVQTELICREMMAILNNDDNFAELKKYISIIKYTRDRDINDHLSSLCTIRIIWGGDATINELRESPLPPKSYDLLFADRFSFCIIHAENYLKNHNRIKVANDFYNDTYLFDQNACTAPHFVYWVGGKTVVQEAQEQFWSALYEVVKQKYTMPDIFAMDKLVTAYSASIAFEDAAIQGSNDNLIRRIHLNRLHPEITRYRCSGGLFYEYVAQSYYDMCSIIDNTYQTLSVVGYDTDEIVNFLLKNRIRGVDRVVPVGRTLDFDLTWDGYDLILMLSRVIS